MTNSQGTEWETATVNDAKLRDIPAIRLVKQGQKNEADVLIGFTSEPSKLGWHVPALFWKRLGPKKPGQKKRRPLGERHTVTVGRDDFMDMYQALFEAGLAPTLWVQNKWTEQLSVTLVLKGLRDWLSARLERS